jgi:hypothetical protein
VVWFPALWPETYSYTLSACLQAGLPVVAPDLGAFPERLSGRAWSWVFPWDSSAREVVSFLAGIREKHFATGAGPEPCGVVEPVVSMGTTWSYGRDYLQGVTGKLSGLPMDITVLADHMPGRGPAAARQARRLKQLALSTLVQLRSSTALRSVVQRIPPRWQTRVKSWLVS